MQRQRDTDPHESDAEGSGLTPRRRARAEPRPADTQRLPTLERLLTIEDLVAILQLPSKKTIYTWRAKGEGPRALRVGKHLRFHPDDVRAWQATRMDPDPEPIIRLEAGRRRGVLAGGRRGQ